MRPTSGDMKISLDADKAPCAANSLPVPGQAGLLRRHQVPPPRCRRQMALNVLQCGDPTGTGTGDPGYEFDEELIDQRPPAPAVLRPDRPESGKEFCTYPAGTVAMAKGGPARHHRLAVLPRLRGLHPRRGVHGPRPDERCRAQGRAVRRREGCPAGHRDAEGTGHHHLGQVAGLQRAPVARPVGSRSWNFRYLGNSGLKISEITYGNWLTHGSQVENDVATQCVRAALDAGISTFDTADVYANTQGGVGARRGPQGRAA